MSRRECASCPELLAENARPTTTQCKTCKSGHRYWKGKGPAKRLRRRRQLRVLDNRLELFNDPIEAGDVIDARPRFAAKRQAAAVAAKGRHPHRPHRSANSEARRRA